MGKLMWLGIIAGVALIVLIALVLNYAENAGTARLSYANNNQNITIANNTTVIVRLNSTYWNFSGSSNSAVLREINVSYNSTPANCTLGAGCGNVTATFNAIEPGYANITAKRINCGESILCNTSQQNFRVDFNVT